MNANLRLPQDSDPLQDRSERSQRARDFTAAEVGALAHLYRGEVYRSTIWRTRLDTTANWAIVLTGVSFSLAFATPDATALPLILAGLLLAVFLLHEARRYRYFNVWRARARLMETDFYAPMLHDGDLHLEDQWQQTLAEDYLRPRYHVGFFISVGRRIRSNYLWILLIQTLAFAGKIAVHPTPVQSWAQAVDRANVGPIPGELLFLGGFLYVTVWTGIAYWSYQKDAAKHRRSGRPRSDSMG